MPASIPLNQRPQIPHFRAPAMEFVYVLSKMTGATSDLLATLRAVSWLLTKAIQTLFVPRDGLRLCAF
jgi:hypothetical protein